MSSKLIYFNKVTPALKKILESNDSRGMQIFYWHEIPEGERKNVLKEADYFLVATEKITKEMLQSAPKLKMVQKTGVGVDNIDIKTAKELGIPVCKTPGANAISVAELTIGMILSLYRKLNLLDKATKNGQWLMWEHRLTSYEVYGKTHGFIGFGKIGKETAKRSKALGTKIIYYDKIRADEEFENSLDAKYMELDEVLKNADIVSLHVPLLPETEGLIGKRELSLMKPTAILINVSRGKIVDENALAEALANNVIAGAGIDAWSSEPVERDNPLLAFDNVVATPHIGAGTKDALNRVLSMAFQNIALVEKGKTPMYVVN
ncbi:MAG: hypothetical protein PWQ82_344 [Thermosediminibacterales bacterium]|nr:hypothetical protein [Thermosediminibacterales bacterium]MDK2835715.1 hypothetical protein [Thermosediminibacterales bacterium]